MLACSLRASGTATKALQASGNVMARQSWRVQARTQPRHSKASATRSRRRSSSRLSSRRFTTTNAGAANANANAASCSLSTEAGAGAGAVSSSWRKLGPWQRRTRRAKSPNSV